jgi:hypothetical protein
VQDAVSTIGATLRELEADGVDVDTIDVALTQATVDWRATHLRAIGEAVRS